MLLHIFALRWTPEATQAQKDQALNDIRSFAQAIPGICSLQTGTNESKRSLGYETIGVLQFRDKAALESYLVHPVHQAFVDSVSPFIEAVDLDLHI